MGEVYRARDTRLQRDVAVKVLPEEFFEDKDRVARFEREARALAALNHPGIAAVYAFEEVSGRHLLVMELADGEGLDSRIARGPIPLDESLDIARQIAEALEAAHEKGIVHRDLKPANVKVTEFGRVKLLDFGLAKALEGDPGTSGAPQMTQSPTLTARATAAGMILGTAAYMSPEQARGKAVDKRADVWAFGALLYEMLSGRRAFEGETVSDTLAAVLKEDPDWSTLPEATPGKVKEILKKCLRRDAKQRLHDIADARLEIEEAQASPLDSPGPLPFEEKTASPYSTVARSASAIRQRGSRKSLWIAWGVAAAFAALAVASGVLALRARTSQDGAPVRRFRLSRLSFSVDTGQTLALSPDGTTLVYRGRGEDGFLRLYMRAFDSFEEKPIPGTEGGGHPFFSPDGAWIGFFAGHNLKKVALSGGSPQLICPAKGYVGGGTWLPDDTIIFAGDGLMGLDRVPARGGLPERILTLDQKTFQVIQTPWALPGGKAVLCNIRMGEEFAMAVVSLVDRTLRTIEKDAYAPVWVPTGHVVFHQGTSLLALPFDPERLTATGSAFPVLTGIRIRVASQVRSFSVSRDGSLVYVPLAPGREERTTLVWIDRRGAVTPVVDLPMNLDLPRLSPDGTRIAFRRPAANCDVWLHDIARGTTTRLTLEGDNHGVAWSPDGRKVAFGRVAAQAGAQTGIMSASTDGSGAPELLAPVERANWFTTSWSPDGRRLLVNWPGRETGGDVGLLPLDGDRKLTPLIQTPFDEGQGTFSRDGRFVAYTSNESGRSEVYVQPYPAMNARVQVSTDGGNEPVWSHTGRELFFRQGKKMVAADVTASPRLSIGRPRVLFQADFATGPGGPGYDVSTDDQRFLVVSGRGDSGADELAVVLNWLEDVRRAASAGGTKP